MPTSPSSCSIRRSRLYLATVLERDDRVAPDPVRPEIDQLAGVERPILPCEAVPADDVAMARALDQDRARRRIERKCNLVAGPVARLLDRPEDDLDGGLIGGQ